MKWLKAVEGIPLTVFAFYFVVIVSTYTRTLNYAVVALFAAILIVHYLYKFTQVKEAQNQIITEFRTQLDVCIKEMMSQRTDISKLNLLFGSIQNRGNPFKANMSQSTFDEDFKVPTPTNSKGNK